jgi:hypothetical protein
VREIEVVPLDWRGVRVATAVRGDPDPTERWQSVFTALQNDA